jgi:hypothetical protein
MHWIRRHPWQSVAGVATTVGAILLLVFAYTSYMSDDSGKAASGDPSSSLPADTNPPEDIQTKLPAVTPPKAFGGSLVVDGGHGLLGSGSSNPAAKHAVTLRVTSPSPIVFVKYYVPTADRNSVAYPVGTSWSLSTTATGPPDYAQMFLQANGRGDPITCTVTVDGKVTDKRTTEGAYGQILCQG